MGHQVVYKSQKYCKILFCQSNQTFHTDGMIFDGFWSVTIKLDRINIISCLENGKNKILWCFDITTLHFKGQF